MDGRARAPLPGEIPVIDIAGLRDGSDAAGIAARIGAACRGIGFFCVVGHGVDAASLAAVRAQAAAFFALPEPEKRAVSIENSPHNRGYVALEAERLDPSRAGDRKEAFNIGRDVPPGDPDAGKPFCGPNQWPARPPASKRRCAAISARCMPSAAICIGRSRAIWASIRIISKG